MFPHTKTLIYKVVYQQIRSQNDYKIIYACSYDIFIRSVLLIYYKEKMCYFGGQVDLSEFSGLLNLCQLHPPPIVITTQIVQFYHLSPDICRNAKLTKSPCMPLFGLTPPKIFEVNVGTFLLPFSFASSDSHTALNSQTT